jgi:hypothetical protein
LNLFLWARFRSTKAAIKLHTLLDLRGPIPSFLEITDGRCHDVNALDVLVVEPGAFYVMDRGYLDFSRLHTLHQAGAYFVIRAKKDLHFLRYVSQPVERPRLTWASFDRTRRFETAVSDPLSVVQRSTR